jgi:hypothetical protein
MPEKYQDRDGVSLNVRICRPVISDSLSRAAFSRPAQEAERGHIPMAPITRVRKKMARKPGCKSSKSKCRAAAHGNSREFALPRGAQALALQLAQAFAEQPLAPRFPLGPSGLTIAAPI